MGFANFDQNEISWLIAILPHFLGPFYVVHVLSHNLCVFFSGEIANPDVMGFSGIHNLFVC